jgi:hypothetical protein
MKRKPTPKPPAYSKYQQWVDAGRPYWTGVALANAVTGYPTLKRTLNAKETPYNRSKLDGFLAEHLRLIPADKLKPEDRQAVAASETTQQQPKPVAEARAQANAAPAARTVKLRGGTAVVIDNPVAQLGPDIPPAWSESNMALPPFHQLPEVLKRARIENNQKRKRATELHSQLADGIADDGVRRDVVQEIVELMDEVTASYDVEREYVLNGTTPELAEDMREQYERLDLFELHEVITNKLAPRVSYWKKQCNLRDGDALVEAKMKLAEAEHEKAMARALFNTKRQRHQEELAALEKQQADRKAKKA